ncbi:MAG TPA: hypothetical protein VKY37_00265, partial [Brumimicrobium sp.]|nr:hypothetical protein [Brumimicrobium sp.]
MKKLLCILTFYALIFTDVKVNAQIQTLSSHPTLTANNGLTTGGVTFEIESTNLIAITGFDQAFYTSTSTVNVWYRVGGVQPSLGTSPDVSAAGGWVVHETGIPVSPSNQTDPTTFTLTNPIVISTGTPVGFFIENGPRYASYTASNQEVFTDGILTLRNGTNYGYSGIAPSLVNHPRQFVGAVHYQVLNTVCGVPQNFNFSNITSTSADLSWTNGAGNASYKVEYGQQGFAPGTGTAITQNITLPSSVETLIGLNPSSPHHVYLTEYCNSGLDSLRFGPFLFNSACGVVVAPYYEAFNNGSEPQCWVNASSDPSTAVNNFWKFSGAPGSGAAANGKTVGTYAWSDGSSPYPDSMVLVTPEVDISQLTTPFLSFEWFSNNTTYPGMNVPLAIWLHDGTSWNLLDILQGDDPEWLFVNYDLNAYANSTIKVAFVTNQSLLTAIQSQNNDILLDEIRI